VPIYLTGVKYYRRAINGPFGAWAANRRRKGGCHVLRETQRRDKALVLVRLAGCGNRRSGGHRVRSRFAGSALGARFAQLVGVAKFAPAVEPTGTVREFDFVVQVAPGAGLRRSLGLPWSVERTVFVRSTGPNFAAEQRVEPEAVGIGGQRLAGWEFGPQGAGDPAPAERTVELAQLRHARAFVAVGKLEFRLALG